MNTENKTERDEAISKEESFVFFRDGRHYVICPACGEEITTSHTEFCEREEADCDALSRCDCESARVWRQIKPSRVMTFASRGDAGIITAPCRFCGQTQPVEVARLSGLPAGEFVTRICKCSSAQSYQGKLEAERRRAEDLSRAAESVEKFFSDFGTSERAQKARMAVYTLLRTGCELVYDRKVAKLTVGIDDSTTAIVSRNGKGNLKIERRDRTGESVEI